MAGSKRQQRLKTRGAEPLAFIFVLLCIPLSLLFFPILSVGAGLEICDQEIKLCEEFLAAPDHKRVRNQREDHLRFPWKSWNAVSSRFVCFDRDFPLAGHRLKHDLLASLTC